MKEFVRRSCKSLIIILMLGAVSFGSMYCGGGGGGENTKSDTAAPVPGSGGNITASYITPNSMTLSWGRASDNKTISDNLEYKVVMSTADNIGSVSAAEANGTTVRDWDDDCTSADVSGLGEGTNYYFNVLVRDEAGNMAVYTQKIAMTIADDAPEAGDGGTIGISDATVNSLKLTWSKADDDVTAQGELQYQVYQSESPNIDTVAGAQANGNIVHTWTADISEKTVTGLNSSSRYYFNVLVKDQIGNISAYNMCNDFTEDDDAALPGNGGHITASNVAVDSIRLNWTKATDIISAQAALRYKVVRSNSNNIATVTDAEANGTVVQDWAFDIQYVDAQGLDSSTRYYFNVLVKDEADNVGVYAMNGFYTSDDDSPVPGNSGTLNIGNVTASSIGISWTKGSDPNFITPDGDIEYKVVRSDAANIDTLANAEANGTTVQNWTQDIASASATGLTDSRKYYFNVIVRDLAGNKAAYSMRSAVTLDTTVPVPGNGGTIITSGVTDSVTLKWTKGSDNLSTQSTLQYKVVQSDTDNINTVANAESNGTVVQDWTADIATKDVTGLTPNSTYYFNVLIKDEADNKAIYVARDVTTSENTVPVPGGGGVITVSNIWGTSFCLNWMMATDNVSGQTALYYKVVKSNSDNIGTVDDAEAYGTVVQDWTPYINMREMVKLTVSTNYYYNVLVKDEAGNKSAYIMGYQCTGNKATVDQTDEEVYTMLNNGNILYIGGHFTRVGARVGCAAILDATSGDSPSTADSTEINHIVNAIVPDGSGGWYIGGEFTRIRGIARQYIARINADGTLHPWNPGASGIIRALAISGNTVYAGGDFTNIGGQERNRIAAIDGITGEVLSWNPDANDSIYALTISGNTIYVGGRFTSMGGQVRQRIASIDMTTGTTTLWNPNANGTVRALSVSGSRVYAGGGFTIIGGQTRNKIAALNTTNGAAVSWNPNADNTVWSLAIKENTVYAGGDFTTIGGQARNKICSLDMTTGTATSWNPQANGGVRTIIANGSTIYVGGGFHTIGGQERNNIAALDVTTGVATSWNPNAYSYSSVLALALYGNAVCAGGSFPTIGGQIRNHIAAIDLITGSVTSWNPNSDRDIVSLSINGNTIYAAGNFTEISGQIRNRIAALDTKTGLATSWNPDLNGMVNTVAVKDSTVYIGGDFTYVGIYGEPNNNQRRNHIAAIDATTGLVTPWDPNSDYPVTTLAVSGNTVYAAGSFSTIGGQPRTFMAALDATTGLATSWNPHPNKYVRVIVPSGNTVYVGGDFTTIGGQTRYYIAALDTITGAATSWNPTVDTTLGNYIMDLSVVGNTVFIGGQFTTICGQPRNNIAAVDATIGTATSWNPNMDYEVYSLAMDENTIYAGGFFQTIGGYFRMRIAAIDLITGLPY